MYSILKLHTGTQREDFSLFWRSVRNAKTEKSALVEFQLRLLWNQRGHYKSTTQQIPIYLYFYTDPIYYILLLPMACHASSIMSIAPEVISSFFPLHSKLIERGKQLSRGKKKFNMDPKKVSLTTNMSFLQQINASLNIVSRATQKTKCFVEYLCTNLWRFDWHLWHLTVWLCDLIKDLWEETTPHLLCG